MAEEAFIEGWRAGPEAALAELRQYRIEIALTAMYVAHNKKGQISYEELESQTITDLVKSFKYNPPSVHVKRCFENLLKAEQLAVDASGQITKGRKF